MNRHPAISPLLQIMLWPVYGKMSDRELQAIYEFLRAIPCVGSADRCGALTSGSVEPGGPVAF
jgi:hypothetical protein